MLRSAQHDSQDTSQVRSWGKSYLQMSTPTDGLLDKKHHLHYNSCKKMHNSRKEQEQPKITKSRIPTFKTIEEEADFWDTHSIEEFADELTPVENVKFVKAGPKKALTVRFDEDTFDG